MWWPQEVRSDAHRPEWEWSPLEAVGPLRFGQSVEEVATVLGEPVSGSGGRPAQWLPSSTLGVDTYFLHQEQTLAAVAVDACRGPQVLYDDVRLVGRLPSELTKWIEEIEGLRIGLNGEAGIPRLGLVMRCQQNGDYARTRPVFVAPEWAEMCVDSWEGSIPEREWRIY